MRVELDQIIGIALEDGSTFHLKCCKHDFTQDELITKDDGDDIYFCDECGKRMN